MELRQLKYFTKVAQRLNFSEAARELFVTQSTLSQQIKQLEEEFGTPLFERDSHSVSLTENGEKLLPLALKTLMDAKDCQNQIRDLQEGLLGELNIGITYSFCPLLTETLKKFHQTYPGVKIKVWSRTMEELMTMLRKREIDFVLSFKPIEFYDDVESHTLFDDKLSVIVNVEHPLADYTIFRIQDIERQQLVIPAKGLQARNTLDQNLDITRQKLNIAVELNEVNVLLDIVQTSNMITILSEATIHGRSRLKAIPLDVPNNQMEGCIHFLKKAYRKRSTKAFVEILRDSNEIYSRINRW